MFGGAIAYLYNKGILFRSLYDIETEDPSMIKRQYGNSFTSEEIEAIQNIIEEVANQEKD